LDYDLHWLQMIAMNFHWKLLLFSSYYSVYKVHAPSLEVFQARLGLWTTWSSGRCPCPWQGAWNEM